MYKTMEYARIVCTKCNKEVTKLLPGKPFKELPICECVKPVAKKKATRKKSNETDV